MYIISLDNSEEVWLVDCGDVDKLSDGVVVKGVLLTHAHFDHMYGLPRLLVKFPDCKVVTNTYGMDTMANARKNMSKYNESPIEVNPSSPLICQDGDSVELYDGVVAKVYETSGHHPSCLSFDVCGYLFTGDAFIPGMKTVTNLPGGNKAMADKSNARIIALAADKTICPGHEI